MGQRVQRPERRTRAQSPAGDAEEMSPTEAHPVAFGLIALLGVGLAIGLIAALGAMLVSRTLVGGGEQVADDSTEQQSMYLPTPSPTAKRNGPGPLVSLGPLDGGGGGDKKSDKPANAISLSAGTDSAGPMERIDLSGTYDEEGAVLQVQRFSDGSWGDFPVTVSVSGGQFSTYVQTSTTGDVKFRVVDSDSGEQSNEVSVQIG